jgi:hypothetical protein
MKTTKIKNIEFVSDIQDVKRIALAIHLGIEFKINEEGEINFYESINITSYNEKEFDAEGGSYLVCTDDEAYLEVLEYIKESVWAFNASFLASYTGLDKEVFKALQPQCESVNKAILSLIKANGSIEDFVEEAVKADGRGHFLSSYDGNENEVDLRKEDLHEDINHNDCFFYIYKR